MRVCAQVLPCACVREHVPGTREAMLACISQGLIFDSVPLPAAAVRCRGTREAMLELYREHYTAHRMRLAVLHTAVKKIEIIN